MTAAVAALPPVAAVPDASAMDRPYHVPVLLPGALALLGIRPDGAYVDATFGAGGHSRAMLEQLGPNGRLIAFDQDPDARANAADLVSDKRFMLVPANFRDLTEVLERLSIDAVDGLLADLGVSSHQFDEPTRGFSYRTEGPLDMRMNPDQPLSAADILTNYPEHKLADVFWKFGELRNARALAKAIVTWRVAMPLETTAQLQVALRPHLPRHNEYDVLGPIFQALRIEVNDELVALHELLAASLKALKPGGSMVVISYHSLEDRPVKNHLRFGNVEGHAQKDFWGNLNTPWEVLTTKAVVPTLDEIARNPRARSAKLRAAVKKLGDGNQKSEAKPNR
jgi:16S rRNA (cytosine1402-N4)-methyltransferase